MSGLLQRTTVQPNLDYKVEVTAMRINRATLAAGGTTSHGGGGKETTRHHFSTWVRERCLGRGGFGVVYLERNPRTGHRRAVKRLEGGDVDLYDREIAEMLRVKRVNKSPVMPEWIDNWLTAFEYTKLFVDFYCWYCDDSCNMYIAMEYHHEGDLKAYVEKLGPFTEAVAKGIAQQILQGVFVLHELEIMHRDIKPDNILVVSRNPMQIKIADFGQAKKYEGSFNTKTGTVGWVAPEVEAQYYSIRGDMWGVGCLIYYLLTSFGPFVEGVVGTPQNLKKFTFHFWPRLQQHKFQEYSDNPGDKPKRGDQIVVKGMSNSANAFLKDLIVRDPARRMTAHEALKHQWICRTSPLQAALGNGDFQLASLLALHDDRYNCRWESDITPAVAPIVLRVAAASGHGDLVNQALEHLPSTYDFEKLIPKWVEGPALLGAATFGSLPIVKMLIDELVSAETSPSILLHACKAALQGGHHQVVELIWPLLSERDRAWDHGLSQLVARYANTAILTTAYNHWTTHNKPSGRMELQTIRRGDPSTAYAHHYHTMLEYAARHGNTQMVKWLLEMRPSQQTVIPDAALRRAIEGGHRDIVTLLLNLYPWVPRAPSAPNQVLTEALVNASFYGHMDIVECLVERGVIPTVEAINDAVGNNNSTIFRYLINALLRTFKLDALHVTQYITPAAVPHCDVRLLNWLCTNRLDRTFPGNAVKHVRSAARFGAIEPVKWFIVKAGKDPHVNLLIQEAIVGASELGHLDIVERLCKNVTDAQITESWEGAAKGGHLAILDHLLLMNPTPNKGILSRALAAAVYANRLGSVLWLLCAGASASNGRGGILKFKCQPTIQALLDDFGYGF